MKRPFTLIAVLFVLLISKSHLSYSQEFMPFTQSSYSGVSGLLLQPASIADSRYLFDMTIFGGDFYASNNYLALKRDGIYKPSVWNDSTFGDKYIVRNTGSNDRTGLVGMGMVLPSFMINVSDNTAFAFSSRFRGLINFDNIDSDFAEVLAENFDVEGLFGKHVVNPDLSVQANFWTEFGITWANVIPLNSERHFLKAGITPKLLLGVASGYVYTPNLDFMLESSDILNIYNNKFYYGLSGNFDDATTNPFKFSSDPGFGLDLGFVYEYRPHMDQYKYDMDGKKDLIRPDKEKYLLRVGVALLDLGGMQYKKDFYSQDFTADIYQWDLANEQIKDVQGFNDTIVKRFGLNPNTEEYFMMRLPTALSLQFDYNAGKNFYINFSPYFAMRKGVSIESKVHNYTTFSLTPRYDLKWFGAALPIQADELGRFRAGLALRLGPVWVGSNTMLSANFANKTYSYDVYFLVKLPIFRGVPRDRDKDAVSDKMDQCIEIPGVWELRGCPDSDADGLTDAQDECPNEPGPADLKGCPDRDGDGIADKNDRCPDLAGKAEYNGCPDSDGDGIIDNDDKCPDQPGPVSLNGCPDKDGDGVIDREDECPDKAGSALMKGCPDSDNDGVADKDDNCPDIPGKKEFGGCPFNDYDKDGVADEQDECPATPGPAITKGCPDTDGDGLADNVDECPKTFGTLANKGCPEIKKEEKAILAKAFSNLEFETGKAIIKASSYSSLNELADMLIAKTDWKVKLSGHTDNTGTAAGNMELSKNRANAVKDYLVGQGVATERIISEWFGQEKPVADNKTAAGRQQNRRVEMKIVFE
ncbi:MAG: DUF5723 family protein [Chloroflexota bacterium]